MRAMPSITFWPCNVPFSVEVYSLISLPLTRRPWKYGAEFCRVAIFVALKTRLMKDDEQMQSENTTFHISKAERMIWFIYDVSWCNFVLEYELHMHTSYIIDNRQMLFCDCQKLSNLTVDLNKCWSIYSIRCDEVVLAYQPDSQFSSGSSLITVWCLFLWTRHLVSAIYRLSLLLG